MKRFQKKIAPVNENTHVKNKAFIRKHLLEISMQTKITLLEKLILFDK